MLLFFTRKIRIKVKLRCVSNIIEVVYVNVKVITRVGDFEYIMEHNIKEQKPSLNLQSDSICAKLFTDTLLKYLHNIKRYILSPNLQFLQQL